jgi:DNA primase
MATPVEKIKERLSIEEVVGSYVKLEHSGQNFKARCPFHNEKTPSFYVSPNRGGYYCFGCGAKGDIFTFVESFEGLDFKGALKVLADRAGVELTPEQPGVKDERDRLFSIMEAAAQYFETAFASAKDIQSYVAERGLTSETIKSFRIGYAPEGWRNLADHLQSLGYQLSEIEEAGLGKYPQEEGKSEGRLYDRFRGRVMFPISDSSGRVIAFSGRIVKDDGTSAKYLNSPETLLFDKSSTLYGLDKAKETIRRLGYAVLVEGQFDLVLAHQAGTKNVVAASGTALADDDGETGSRGIANMKMLARLCKNIVLSFDGDTAGVRATYRGTRLGYRLQMDVKVAVLPDGKDPADIIREGGNTWQEVLRTTLPAILFFTKRIRTEAADDRIYLKRVRDELLPIIALLPSAIDIEHSLKILERETGVAVESWKHDLRDVISEPKQTFTPLVREPQRLFVRASDRFFGLMAWQESVQSPLIDTALYQKRLEESIGEETWKRLRDATSDKLEALVFEAEAAFTGESKLSSEADMLVNLVTEEVVKAELHAITSELRHAEANHDPTISVLLDRHKKLTEKLENVRRTRHEA